MQRATDDEVREYLKGLGWDDARPGFPVFELGRDVVDLRKSAGQCFDAWANLRLIDIHVRQFSPEFLEEMRVQREVLASRGGG